MSMIPSHDDGSGAMFDRIARRYDFLNRVLSFGLDRGWRRCAVERLALLEHARVLDLATGTADLAMQIAEAYPTCTAIGLDPSQGMLACGQEKVHARGLAHRIVLQCGRAEELPFPEASFDAVTVAFGIRNVPDRPAALREMARVLRPGGKVVILELSEPRSLWARFYVHWVVPCLGALLSNVGAYRYLQRSIAVFPPPHVFAGMLETAGLTVTQVRPFCFGVSHLYVAGKK